MAVPLLVQLPHLHEVAARLVCAQDSDETRWMSQTNWENDQRGQKDSTQSQHRSIYTATSMKRGNRKLCKLLWEIYTVPATIPESAAATLLVPSLSANCAARRYTHVFSESRRPKREVRPGCSLGICSENDWGKLLQGKLTMKEGKQWKNIEKWSRGKARIWSEGS